MQLKLKCIMQKTTREFLLPDYTDAILVDEDIIISITSNKKHFCLLR